MSIWNLVIKDYFSSDTSKASKRDIYVGLRYYCGPNLAVNQITEEQSGLDSWAKLARKNTFAKPQHT